MIDIHNRQRTHSSIQHINAPFKIQTNFTFSNHTLFSEGRTNDLLTLCCKTFKQFSFKIYIVFLLNHVKEFGFTSSSNHVLWCRRTQKTTVYRSSRFRCIFRKADWTVNSKNSNEEFAIKIICGFFSENFHLCFSFR